MHPMIQLALRTMTALTVAYHTIWACAPAVHLPPPMPMGKEDGFTVGGSLVGGAWDVNQQASLERVTPFVSGQAFGMVAVSERWNLGGTAYLGMSTLLGAGVIARLDLVEANRFYLGAQAGGGFAYGSIGVPVGVGVTDSLWLYTHPNVLHHDDQRVELLREPPPAPGALGPLVADDGHPRPGPGAGHQRWPRLRRRRLLRPLRRPEPEHQAVTPR